MIIVGSGLAGLTAALKANTDIYSTDKPFPSVMHIIPDFYDKGTLDFLKKHGIELKPFRILNRIVGRTENAEAVIYKKSYFFMRGNSPDSLENQLKDQLRRRGLKIIKKEIDFSQLKDKGERIIDATGCSTKQSTGKFYGRGFAIKKRFDAFLIYFMRGFRGYIYAGPLDDGSSELGLLSDKPISDETVSKFKKTFFRNIDFRPHHNSMTPYAPLDLGSGNIFKIGNAAGLFDPFWFSGAPNAFRSAIYATMAKNIKHYRKLMNPIVKKIALTTRVRKTLTAEKLEKMWKFNFWPINRTFNVNYFKLLPLFR